jgi:Streptomyces sporulation and cell division protein, SsgA
MSGSRLGRVGWQMSRSSSTTISAELGLRLVIPQQTIVPLVASLYYSGSDPYAVRMAFHVGTDDPVEWIFARDLLATGIESRQGEGDVHVWPSAGSCTEAGGLDVIGATGTEGTVLNIELSSPFGQAHFEAPARAMSAFLQRTYQIVPAGQETDYIDIETELNDLLGQA